MKCSVIVNSSRSNKCLHSIIFYIVLHNKLIIIPLKGCSQWNTLWILLDSSVTESTQTWKLLGYVYSIPHLPWSNIHVQWPKCSSKFCFVTNDNPTECIDQFSCTSVQLGWDLKQYSSSLSGNDLFYIPQISDWNSNTCAMPLILLTKKTL